MGKKELSLSLTKGCGLGALCAVLLLLCVGQGSRLTGVGGRLVLPVLLCMCLGTVLLLARLEMLKTPAELLTALLVLLGATLVRMLGFDHVTGDYVDFLSRWVAYLRQNGGFAALNQSIGNYNVPYLYFLAIFSYLPTYSLYLIKLLSTAFDFALAFAVLLLVRHFTGGRLRALIAFGVTLLLPTVVLNSAWWAQCDSVYVSLALLSLWCVFDEKPVASVVLLALSFSFKLQAVFFIPIYLVFLFTKRLKIWHVALFPATYVAAMLPALLCGRPFMETITLYFDQMDTVGGGLNYNSSSVYAFVNRVSDADAAAKLGIIAAFALVVAVWLVFLIRRRQANDGALLVGAILLAVGIPLLLPHMHDRYFYGADALTLVLAFVFAEAAAVPVLSQFASLLGYHAYLVGRYYLPMKYGAVGLMAVCAYLAVKVVTLLWPRQSATGGKPSRLAAGGKPSDSSGASTGDAPGR